jgi:hypothetical protein
MNCPAASYGVSEVWIAEYAASGGESDPKGLNDQGRIRSCRAIGQDAEVYMTIEEDGLFIGKNRNGERDKTLPIVIDKPHFRFIEKP